MSIGSFSAWAYFIGRNSLKNWTLYGICCGANFQFEAENENVLFSDMKMNDQNMLGNNNSMLLLKNMLQPSFKCQSTTIKSSLILGTV